MGHNRAMWKNARLKLVQDLLFLVKQRPDCIKSIRIGGNTIHITDEQATTFLNIIKRETEAVQ